MQILKYAPHHLYSNKISLLSSYINICHQHVAYETGGRDYWQKGGKALNTIRWFLGATFHALFSAYSFCVPTDGAYPYHCSLPPRRPRRPRSLRCLPCSRQLRRQCDFFFYRFLLVLFCSACLRLPLNRQQPRPRTSNQTRRRKRKLKHEVERAGCRRRSSRFSSPNTTIGIVTLEHEASDRGTTGSLRGGFCGTGTTFHSTRTQRKIQSRTTRVVKARKKSRGSRIDGGRG